MAIYHLNAAFGSRKSGQSASAKHDYIMRSGKYAPGFREVLFSESGNLPEWAVVDPRIFWEAADLHERENACLFRQFEFSLPIELSEKNRIALVRKFIEELTVGREGERGRMPYSWAIHRGGQDGHNPHGHLILSERLLPSGASPEPEVFFRDPRGGGCRKSRRFSGGDRKKELLRIRERWAALANEALATAGAPERIDHRSFEDMGINDFPDVHLGAKTSAQERKGQRTVRGDRAVRRRRARRRLAELDGYRKRIDHEIGKETGDGGNIGSDRSRQGRSGPGEQGRHDPRSHGQGSEEIRRVSEKDCRHADPDRSNREASSFDPRNFGRGSDPVFDFGDLVRSNRFVAKIVRESGPKPKNYWSEWREKVLSEAYGEEIRLAMVSRWKVRKMKDSIEFRDWKDPQTKITDLGGQIVAESGNVKEIQSMIELARIKGWKTVEWGGNDAFLRNAFKESFRAGILVDLRNENQRRIWHKAQAEMEQKHKVSPIETGIKP